MRVLITGDVAGGVGMHAADLAQGLAHCGHRITIALLGAKPEICATIPGVETVAAPWLLEWQSEVPAPDLAEATAATRAWLSQVAASRAIQLFHTNHFSLVGAVPQTPTLLGIHSDVFSWWRWVRGMAPPRNDFTNWYGSQVSAALRGAQAVVAPSHSTLCDLRQSFGWTGAAHVIPHGVLVPQSPPRNKHLVAITAGRLWDEGKQAGLLAGVDLPMPVEVAGDARGRVIPSSPWLRVLGKLDRAALARRLAEASIYIATSRYEPFGLAPLEAAAAGCALLLNDIPSLREIWGTAALFFTRNDAHALAQQLHRLCREPRVRDRIARASHRRARRLYGADTMMRRYAALYRQLLGA